MIRARHVRRAVVPAVVPGVLALALAGCGQPSDLAPPTAPVAAARPVTSPAATPTAPATPAVPASPDAEDALREYLRQQALAVNAGTADPAAVPGFTASLTPEALSWAVPLLAANFGDRMPGPYPVGVLGQRAAGPDRVDLDVCLQDRGWQVDPTTGTVRNAPHHATATAVVVRRDGRWLLDDLSAAGGTCTAADVTEERF